MDDRIKEHARILVNWSAEIKKGDNVVIVGSPESHDLILALYEIIGEKQAKPITLYSSNEADRSYLSNIQKGFETPEHQLELYKKSDSFIRIKSDPNLMSISDISGNILSKREKAMESIRDEMLSKKWVLTQHPTNSSAQLAGMSLSKYKDFVYNSIIRNWKEISEKQEILRKKLENTNKVRIEGGKTKLEMSIKGMKAVNSDGKHNMPSGEVFTAPSPDSVQGEVLFNKPLIHKGREIENVRLVFEDGEIIESSAEKNHELLENILNTDEGSRKLGELGIGNNEQIDKFTKNMLFDEKMNKTIHLAIGQAYEECIGKNQEKNDSAIHLDMITSMEDKTLYFDDEIVQEEGVFTWKEKNNPQASNHKETKVNQT